MNKDAKKKSLFEKGVFRPSKGRGLNKFFEVSPGPPLRLDQPLHFKTAARSLSLAIKMEEIFADAYLALIS